MREVFEAIFKASGVSEFQKAFAQAEQASKQLNKAGKSMRDIGSTMTKRVTLPIMGVATAVAVTGAKFDDQMQTVQAVTRASGKELENMRELAKDMGKTTRFSASEAAEGMEMLARAGFETDEIMVAIPEVLNLAAAGAVDLGSAADITSNILSGFKMEADETGRVVDVLAQASADSNVDVESLGEAMKYVAPVASDLGISIEDTTAAIGFLGDAGIQGGQAGRQLRSGLQSLAAPTDQAASLMSELGIEIFDANGKMKDLPSIIGELETGLDGMSDAQRTAALETLFGKDAMSAWSVLIGEGSDELGIFSNELANSNGAAKEMSDTMEDSVAGAFREMKSAIEGLAIEFYEMGDGPLKSLIESVTKLINKFTESSDATKQWVIIIAGVAAAIGPVVWVLGHVATAVSVVMGVVSAFATTLAAGGTAMAAFKAAMLAIMGPVGWVVAAIAALIAIGVALYTNWETIQEYAFNIWGAIKEFFMVTIPEIVGVIIEWFGSLPERFTEWFSGVMERVTEWASNMWESAVETGSNFLEGVMEFFNQLPERIGFAIGFALGTVVRWSVDMWNKARETGSNFLMSIVEWFSQLPGRIQTWITNAYNNVVTWASNMASKAREAGSQFITNVINYVQQLPGRIQTWLTNTISRLTTWVSNMGSKGREAGTDLLNKTVNAVKELPGKMADAGKDVVRGFWNGIKSLGSWVSDKVTGFFTGIVDGAKSALKIKSPSRVFMELGEFTGEGFALGIEDTSKMVNRSMQAVTSGAMDIANRDFNADLQASHNLASGTVQHSIQDMQTSKQPVYMNLNIGGREHRGMVDDITKLQDATTEIELSYT